MLGCEVEHFALKILSTAEPTHSTQHKARRYTLGVHPLRK